ncbi:hypothetical protein Dimus_017302 [Dionaea muscipula]
MLSGFVYFYLLISPVYFLLRISPGIAELVKKLKAKSIDIYLVSHMINVCSIKLVYHKQSFFPPVSIDQDVFLTLFTLPSLTTVKFIEPALDLPANYVLYFYVINSWLIILSLYLISTW